VELSERSLLSGSKNIPRLNYDSSAGQFMNSSVVIRSLGMKQCLHRVYDLVFPVSIPSLPGFDKILGLATIVFRKIIN
jgi:hypothetical protein